jgi:peptidoglycan glycosyltransferase
MYRETFFPGSTFKVVTGSIGVQSGLVTQTQPVFPAVTSYTPPQTNRPLRNFGGEVCGGALFDILAKSCNSSFANMGVDIGPAKMIAGAELFGFNDRPPIDLPAAARSRFPTDFNQNLPALAQSSIGQNSVSASPLEMALVAGAVANGGQIMAPHLLDEIRDSDGNVVRSARPTVWKSAISPQTADVMHQAMIQVVQRGTATRLAVPGFEVGGKTGTAQTSSNPPTSHAWIVGWAGPPGDAKVAVAVIVERQSGESEATGGRVAAPIAQAVMAKVLQVQG